MESVKFKVEYIFEKNTRYFFFTLVDAKFLINGKDLVDGLGERRIISCHHIILLIRHKWFNDDYKCL